MTNEIEIARMHGWETPFHLGFNQVETRIMMHMRDGAPNDFHVQRRLNEADPWETFCVKRSVVDAVATAHGLVGKGNEVAK